MKLFGIDAGATWVKAAAFSTDGRIERSVTLPSLAREGRARYFDGIAVAAEQIGVAVDDMVGMAVPGLLTPDGRVLRYAANIAGLSDVTGEPVLLEREFAARLPTRRVVAENDAKCAGLAEWQRGRGGGKPERRLLHVTWGTGIGTAWVVDGIPVYGWEGGHVPLSWGRGAGYVCGCGSRRDLEAYCAVPHLVARGELAPEALLAAAQAGRRRAAATVLDAVRWFARGLHTMSVLVYPDIVTIGGGFMASDWLLEQVRREVAAQAHGYLRDTLRPDMVHRAALGNEAGMLGAALVAKRRFG